jgi:hypothetical protein
MLKSIPRWAPAAGLAALAFVVRFAIGPLPIDDAYITFRSARNLAEGLGFVYNAGQHVLGTTTPLWAMVLALGYRLGMHDLPTLALILSAACDGLAAVLLLLLARRLGWGSPWPALLSALYALSAPSIAFAVSGMETSLFVLLILGAVAATAAGRGTGAALLAGLATLTRPEGLLLGFLVLASIALRQSGGWRQRWREVGMPFAVFAAVIVPWVIFATWWFGSPLPQSMAAKSVAYLERIPPQDALLRLMKFLGQPGWHPLAPPLSLLKWRVSGIGFSRVCVLLWLFMVPALIRATRDRPARLPAIWFGPLFILAYALSGLRGVPLCPWYMVPLAPFLLLGALSLARQVSHRGPLALQAGLIVLVTAWSLSGLSLGREPGQLPFRPLGITLAKEDALDAAAKLLAPKLGPGSVVALPEIGVFGYISRARILDGAGLVSPEAVRYFPIPLGEETFPPALIRDERPDYLVAVDWYFTDKLVHERWFQDDYDLIAGIPCALAPPEPHAVLVYARAHEPGTIRPPESYSLRPRARGAVAGCERKVVLPTGRGARS